MHKRNPNHQSRAGQAMIELMLGMILILILLAGTVQFLNVANAHTGMDATIRGQAGYLAMSPGPAENTPKYIQTWLPGPDGQPFTADDVAQLKSPNTPNAIAVIANESVVAPADWTVLDTLSNTPSLEVLSQEAGFLTALGFVDVSEAATVPVSDLAQSLFYSSQSVTVKEDVWMPIMSGLY